MAAPLSYDRVLSALRRLFPFELTITRSAGAAPAAGDSKIGREMGSIAWMVARATDYVEAMAVELFPDTVVESITRWERIARIASNTTTALADRRNKVVAVFQRSAGIQFTRLQEMLFPVLDLPSAEDVVLIEHDRGQLNIGMMEVGGDHTLSPVALSSTAYIERIDTPWPSTVDDMGVRVHLIFSAFALATTAATLTSPNGTVWSITLTAADAYYETRTEFLDETAGGTWTLALTDSSTTSTFVQWELNVSNDTDSRQIYNFYAYCDESIAGTPDIQEAQRLFNRTALAHMNSKVITSEAFIVDLSLVDREPVE